MTHRPSGRFSPILSVVRTSVLRTLRGPARAAGSSPVRRGAAGRWRRGLWPSTFRQAGLLPKSRWTRCRRAGSRLGGRGADMVVTGTERDRLGYRRAAAPRSDRVNLTQWLQYGQAGMG